MGRTGKIQNVLRLMRPRHYIKNLLILVSVTFDRNLFRPAVLAQALLGFGAFCLLASAVYVLNDIRDVEADRQHEIKRARPIASGAVDIPEAWGLAALLLAASLAVQLAAFGNRGNSLLLMLAYFAVNLGYSLGLKHVPFLDIVLLVMGFVLRVVYGAAIVGSSTSAWVYLTVFALSFYLGESGQLMYLCLTLAVTFYALWSADEEVAARYGTDKLIWTVPMVIIILMKYSADIESSSYGDPVDVISQDKVLLGLCVLFGLAMVGLIYLPGL